MQPFIAQWYHSCPHCQKPLVQTAEAARCPACNFVFYLNPAPCTTNIIAGTDGRVLLGKRAIAPQLGWWDILGGFIEGGETAEASALREVFEETNLTVEIVTQLGPAVPDTYGPLQIPTLNFIFVTRVIGGELKAQDDVGELAWFEVEKIPAELAFNNAKIAVERYREYLLTLR